ncbi:MAG: NADH-quinone oxidoreductase subunit A [Halobacteriovoraceae bacterium]|jgi:NADH-quinone oxidoreductase subunit A|nr:NADH-quinone oxidoreductase subunit A [Halobacteriovoraceae bacterium]MBT5093120.1 NADH-quinone oxidoreductase subunit A [Halobacteriovoraceae bacterium]
MDLFPLFVFLLLVLIIGASLLLLSNWLGYKKSHNKEEAFESGVSPVGKVGGRINIKFYKTLVFFLLFQAQMLLLYPWALSYGESTVQKFLIGEFLASILLLAAGFLFLLSNKAFDWGEE